MRVLFKPLFTIFVVINLMPKLPASVRAQEATVATHQIEAIPISENLFVKSWFPRNPLLRFVRRVFIGIPSELCRWINGLMRLRRADVLIIPGTGLLTDAHGPFSLGYI
jgi:hypothetical protein